jgi:enoyl-CoA hydratase
MTSRFLVTLDRGGKLRRMAELHIATDDGVAVLTLEAPDRRNALTLDLVDEVVAALDQVESDPEVRALVVTGAPPAFCAGADLSHLGESQREGLLRIYEGFLRVGRSPLPTVAAVNGPAVGAGVNLALACDVIVAGVSSRFDTRFLKLGLHPGGGHTWMLRRRVGPQVAAALVLFGQVVDGTEAERVGLAWRCVPDGELLPTATALAATAAAGPPDLVAHMKQTLADVAVIPTQVEAVERELDPQVWSINQPAFKERLAAIQRRISGD